MTDAEGIETQVTTQRLADIIDKVRKLTNVWISVDEAQELSRLFPEANELEILRQRASETVKRCEEVVTEKDIEIQMLKEHIAELVSPHTPKAELPEPKNPYRTGESIACDFLNIGWQEGADAMKAYYQEAK